MALDYDPSRGQVNLVEVCEATLLFSVTTICSVFVVLKAIDFCFLLYLRNHGNIHSRTSIKYVLSIHCTFFSI
jgi:hypothetical protein